MILTTMTRPLRILCADDNAMLGDVMLCLFAKAGHWVEHVNDGLRAWDRISQDLTDFDVVVTDHQMPGLTGLELVELLRQANYSGRIVVHSSSLKHEEIAAYRGFGVASVVQKAARPDDLLTAVETSVG
jgi:CheY-like chemotaxis protein